MTEPRNPEAGGPLDEVASARQKFHCPACGAEATWNPAKQALICSFCGTVSPVTLSGAAAASVAIVEHDLLEALGQGQLQRGWAVARTSVQCQSCHAISVFDPERVGGRCEFCGSASLVPYEQVADPFRPESLLPIRVAEPQARELIRGWYQRQWLAPNRFAVKAMTDTAHGIYLPYWTFDAKAAARWTADSGVYFYVRENNRQVRKVRWSPASGALAHAFDDELVCGSVGIDSGKLRAIEPFPTDALVPYDPGYLAGWTVERYQLDLNAAARRSREQMLATLREMCARQVPGDTHRNLNVDANFTEQRFKQILAPVWLMTYVYRGQSYQVAVNGVTGAVAGSRPWSWIKISLLVILALIILYIVANNS